MKDCFSSIVKFFLQNTFELDSNTYLEKNHQYVIVKIGCRKILPMYRFFKMQSVLCKGEYDRLVQYDKSLFEKKNRTSTNFPFLLQAWKKTL